MKYINFKFENNLVSYDTNYDKVECEIKEDKTCNVTIYLNYHTAYGFGEKYDFVNQFGKVVNVSIKEVCFNQGDMSYFTFPFLMSADGFGIYVKSKTPVKFDLTSDSKIIISYMPDSKGLYGDIKIYEGTPKQIIKEFKEDTIKNRIFPKWVLGAWMSSNRWENDEHIYEQLDELNKSEIPHNVMVIERWSDLTTFYNWWGSESPLIEGDKYHAYENFGFDKGLYKNPKKLFEDIHSKNLHVILWDLPVFATEQSIEGPNPEQRYKDNEYVVKKKLCILENNDTPYHIPHPNWFRGSMIPDFSNEECVKYWFNHRKHLFEIGIDGFKCDGGEFIHKTDIKDSLGNSGLELINHYASEYLKAYANYMNENQIVFARSGDEYTPGYAITWAGDQETTWPELRHIMTCLLSSSASGINYWGFDITGFSGQLPTQTLYKRGIQLATFVPIMQWHSDPVVNGGWDHSLAWKINDRSPWNLAKYHKSKSLMEEVGKYFNLHYSLIPYFYSLSLDSKDSGIPAVRHLIYEFSEDNNTFNIDDEFMLGDAILVCPILEDYIEEKRIYLPEGNWYDLYTKEKYVGGKYCTLKVNDDIIPTFIKENKIIPLNLPTSMILGDKMTNDLSKYSNLAFLYTGDANYKFKDDLGNEICLEIQEQKLNVLENKTNQEFSILNINELKTMWK